LKSMFEVSVEYLFVADYADSKLTERFEAIDILVLCGQGHL